jgi:hypothetical protein
MIDHSPSGRPSLMRPRQHESIGLDIRGGWSFYWITIGERASMAMRVPREYRDQPLPIRWSLVQPHRRQKVARSTRLMPARKSALPSASSNAVATISQICRRSEGLQTAVLYIML